jgi:hypothetical protein
MCHNVGMAVDALKTGEECDKNFRGDGEMIMADA